MECRSIGADGIEIRQQGDSLKIAGYAAVYDSPSQVQADIGVPYIEFVRRGAFDKSLAEVAAGTRDVVARFNHQGGMKILARTSNRSLELRSDSRGLHYVATLPNTTMGRDVHEMVRSGLAAKSSFAFFLPSNGDRVDFTQSPAIRELIDLELVDVAPLTEPPAYMASSVTARTLGNAELEHYSEILKRLQESAQ